MDTTGHRRRELFSIVSVFLGAFVGIALFPTALTGPVGQAVRRFLLTWLGSGAILIPMTLLAVAIVGFGRMREMSMPRLAVLGTGLVFLVPYLIAVATG